MKTVLTFPTLLLAALVATACQDDPGVTALVDDYIEQRNAQAEVLCDCHQELGFENRSSCLRDNGQILPAKRRCIIDAFERNESASADFLECYLPLEDEFRACLDDRLTCNDFQAATACVEDYDIGSRDCITLPAAIERAYKDCF